jgi:carboxylesterase type B
MLRQTVIKNGKVKGLPGNDPRITVYKGIPFAAPPVGDLRWKAPQPCEDWEGTLEAYQFGPISVQDQPAVGTDIYCKEWHVDPDIPMSEDCLYLNVWTPAKTTDEKLPVLLWYFGGGFQWGYTAEMEFNGERLARRGIVVVSVNYRLAALGFLAHPDLTAESPDAPANFGLLDQKAGLNWVKDNIAAFGGDPENITIAGQSAGGGSVLNQITNEDNFGIIKGAVIMSGLIRFPGDDILFPVKLSQAEEKGKEFLEYLGVSSIAEARKLDAFEIRNKYGEWAQNHPRFAPCEDGVNYKTDALMSYEGNKFNGIPVIAGYTIDEFDFGGVHVVEKTVKESCAKAVASGAGPIYVYEFGTDIPGEDNPGNFHSVDLWFWFDNVIKCWRPMRGRHFELARQMANYLAGFVKTHDPNCKDDDGTQMPVWKAYSSGDADVMKFTSEGAIPS